MSDSWNGQTTNHTFSFSMMTIACMCRFRDVRLPSAIFGTERYFAITTGVTVWGAIYFDNWSPLTILQGTLMTRNYIAKICICMLVLLIIWRHIDEIYHHYNARPHTAWLSQWCLLLYTVLPWSTRTQDRAALIQHICYMLERMTSGFWKYYQASCQLLHLWKNLL